MKSKGHRIAFKNEIFFKPRISTYEILHVECLPISDLDKMTDAEVFRSFLSVAPRRKIKKDASIMIKDSKTGKLLAWVIRGAVCGKISSIVKTSSTALFESNLKTTNRSTKRFKSQEEQRQIRFLGIWRKYSSKAKFTSATCPTANDTDLAKWEEAILDIEKEGLLLIESGQNEEGLNWINQARPLFQLCGKFLELFQPAVYDTYKSIKDRLQQSTPDF
jgi:hypothetical protein